MLYRSSGGAELLSVDQNGRPVTAQVFIPSSQRDTAPSKPRQPQIDDTSAEAKPRQQALDDTAPSKLRQQPLDDTAELRASIQRQHAEQLRQSGELVDYRSQATANHDNRATIASALRRLERTP